VPSGKSPGGVNSAQTSRSLYQSSGPPISSQQSQKAAALLIDLRLSIFAEWGLIEANTRRGVFRVKILTVVRALAR